MRGIKKIDWLNHFLQFIVVVIGILLAFQLNTCREDKKEATLVAQHITNIIEKSTFNENRVNTSIIATEKALETINSLLDGIQKKQNPSILSGLSYQLLSFESLYLKKNAFNSLKESGDIRFIKDFDLKNDIITLYEYYNWASGMDEAALEVYTTYYYPYTVENFDMASGLAQEMDVYNNKKFINILISYKYILQARLQQTKETRIKIASFLEDKQ